MKSFLLEDNSISRFRKDYINEHAKFMHSSYLLSTDLGREFEYENETYSVIGLWDYIGYEKIILIKNQKTGYYSVLPSKLIAAALGYDSLRNLVTGEPSIYSNSYGKNKKSKKWKKLENN